MKEFYFSLIYYKEHFDAALEEVKVYEENNPLLSKTDFLQNIIKEAQGACDKANEQLNQFITENRINLSTIKEWDEEYALNLHPNFFTQTVDRLN